MINKNMARYNIVEICLFPPAPPELENNKTVVSQKCIFLFLVGCI
jgi:hypothetical protein